MEAVRGQKYPSEAKIIMKELIYLNKYSMKVSQHPQKPLGGSNQIWSTTSGKKDLRGHSMYIATGRTHLEAREAGFLVF